MELNVKIPSRRICGAKTPGGRGGTSYERGRDARRLAKGCKFRILVSGCSGKNAIMVSREGLV